MAVTSVALSLVAAALLVVPQRLAQRPLLEGVLTVGLAGDGSLTVGTRVLPASALPALVSAASRRSLPPRVRLLPAPDVPWQEVRRLLRRLESTGRDLELQLP